MTQDETFEWRQDTGKMKQNLLHFRNVSTGEKKMCAVTGNIRSGEFETVDCQCRVKLRLQRECLSTSQVKCPLLQETWPVKMPRPSQALQLTPKKAPAPIRKDEGITYFVDSRQTQRSRRWCEAEEEIAPTVPLKTSDE